MLSKKNNAFIMYMVMFLLLFFFFCQKAAIYLMLENLRVILLGNLGGDFWRQLFVCIFLLVCIIVFVLGVFCFIQGCSILDSFFEKSISHILFSIVFLVIWICLKKQINSLALGLIGIALLVRIYMVEIRGNRKKFNRTILIFLVLCSMIIFMDRSSKNYTGELIYNITERDNIGEVFFNYKSEETYKRAGTEVENNRIVYSIDDTFMNSEESVLTVTRDKINKESVYLGLCDFNIYSGNALVDNISGTAWMSFCDRMYNLEPLKSEAGIEYFKWTEDTYAQIYFNKLFSEWIEISLITDINWILQATTFLIVLFIVKKLLVKLLNNKKIVLLNKNRKALIIFNIILILSLSIGEVILVEILSDSIKHIIPKAFLINILLVFAINLIVFALFKLRATAIVSGAFFGVIGLINHYTLLYRGTPVLPWDVYAAKTAVNVVGNYHIYITWEMIWAFLVLLIPVAACFISCKKMVLERVEWKERVLILGIGVLCSTCFINSEILKTLGIRENVYNQKNNYMENGWFLASMMNMKYIRVEKPENYSEEKVQEILARYQTNMTSSSIEDAPNIVIVLNESFADLHEIYSLKTNKDVTPFMDSLQGENTALGTCYVSQIGGGTCNSEYELLMGSTMAFFPSGSIVFQQHMNDEQYSLINILNNRGYTTIGMHPMPGSNWNRTEAYPRLQFKKEVFYDDLFDKEFIRKYTSDRYCYKWIIEQFENKSEGEKLAIYNLTVQNHGGYEEKDYVGDISIKNEDSIAWNQYLSLIHESDKALEELLEYFSTIEEKVILLFLGDHQPALPSLSDSDTEDNSSTKEKYAVPYLLWNNYDSPMEIPETISINYLATYLLKNCNLQRSLYYIFLEEMSKNIPIVIASGYEQDNNFYQWEGGKSNEWLEKYRILQYGLSNMEDLKKSQYYE